MKKLAIFALGFIIASPVFADNDLSTLLNKVSLQLTANKWITSQTAKVMISVDAGLSDQGIEKLQGDVLAKLSQIAGGDWHITGFTRSQDKSGLESVHINAEARLPQAQLADLRGKAKSVSKPGETYTVSAVQFTPSDEEVTQSNIVLRGMIYQQAKAEIDALNKVYPDQKFYIYQIDFNSMPSVMPMAARTMEVNMAAAASPAPAPLNVGGKQYMTANVILASTPEMISRKLSPLVNP
jgi:hypothetical protein